MPAALVSDQGEALVPVPAAPELVGPAGTHVSPVPLALAAGEGAAGVGAGGGCVGATGLAAAGSAAVAAGAADFAAAGGDALAAGGRGAVVAPDVCSGVVLVAAAVVLLGVVAD